MEKWAFEFMMLCNEARVELDKNERDESDEVRYAKSEDEQEINEYINSLDEKEKANALQMLSMGVNPKPNVKINMHY